jgi:hypothetical protein
LESWGKLAWMPILGVASLSLLVSFSNYRLQITGSAPNLEFTNGDLGGTSPGQYLRLYFQNNGKTMAWQGHAKLYDFDDSKAIRPPFGEADIAGAGGRVMPSSGGTADFNLATTVPPRFLICVTYSDLKQVYKRAFLTSARRQLNSIVGLVAEPPPAESSCP